jgi:hypothetical protein
MSARLRHGRSGLGQQEAATEFASALCVVVLRQMTSKAMSRGGVWPTWLMNSLRVCGPARANTTGHFARGLLHGQHSAMAFESFDQETRVGQRAQWEPAASRGRSCFLYRGPRRCRRLPPKPIDAVATRGQRLISSAAFSARSINRFRGRSRPIRRNPFKSQVRRPSSSRRCRDEHFGDCAMRRAISAWTATGSTARPRQLTEIPIGTQGVGFDRLELDAWVDDYIARNGRPARKGKPIWDAEDQPGSSVARPHLAHPDNKSRAGPFDRALARIDLDEAEMILARLIDQERHAVMFGRAPDASTFAEAAARFVLKNMQHKRSDQKR